MDKPTRIAHLEKLEVDAIVSPAMATSVAECGFNFEPSPVHFLDLCSFIDALILHDNVYIPWIPTSHRLPQLPNKDGFIPEEKSLLDCFVGHGLAKYWLPTMPLLSKGIGDCAKTMMSEGSMMVEALSETEDVVFDMEDPLFYLNFRLAELTLSGSQFNERGDGFSGSYLLGSNIPEDGLIKIANMDVRQMKMGYLVGFCQGGTVLEKLKHNDLYKKSFKPLEERNITTVLSCIENVAYDQYEISDREAHLRSINKWHKESMDRLMQESGDYHLPSFSLSVLKDARGDGNKICERIKNLRASVSDYRREIKRIKHDYHKSRNGNTESREDWMRRLEQFDKTVTAAAKVLTNTGSSHWAKVARFVSPPPLGVDSKKWWRDLLDWGKQTLDTSWRLRYGGVYQGLNIIRANFPVLEVFDTAFKHRLSEGNRVNFSAVFNCVSSLYDISNGEAS